MHIADWDRPALERLCRYCSRHPFAKGRLHCRDDKTLVYRFAKPDLAGRTQLTLTPFELFDRLADLIAPPRRHRHRYFGALAPNSLMRPFVTLTAGSTEQNKTSDDDANHALPSSVDDPPPPRRYSSLWAILIAKVYQVLPILCPNCHAEMKLVSLITQPRVIDDILTCIGQPNEPPRLSPARGPPQTDFDFGQDYQTDDASVPF